MSQINKTNSDASQYRPISVEKIESLSQVSQSPHIKEDKKSSLKKMGALLTFVKKIFTQVDEDRKSPPSKSSLQKHVYHDLIKLKKFLNRIKETDLSENLDFLREFASFWKRHVIDKHLFNSSLPPEVEKIFLDIHNFHYETEQPFGYYLVEYLENDWTPRPFINLIYHLHESHVQDPLHSSLTSWTAYIENILKEFPR